MKFILTFMLLYVLFHVLELGPVSTVSFLSYSSFHVLLSRFDDPVASGLLQLPARSAEQTCQSHPQCRKNRACSVSFVM